MVELGELEIIEGVKPDGCSCRGLSVFLLDDSSTNQRTEFRQEGRDAVDLTGGKTRTLRFKVSWVSKKNLPKFFYNNSVKFYSNSKIWDIF